MAEKKEYPKFSVLGAGNGGMAMAAHLSLMGFSVSLYNRGEERIRPVKLQGAIELVATDLENVPHGMAEIPVVTTDIAEAIAEADVIMVTTPALGHAPIAEASAPHLRDGQIVVLNPGRTGGALEFYNIVKKERGKVNAIISEAQTLIYASRITNPGQVKIFSVKSSIPVAALPAHRTVEVVKALRHAYPQFVPGDNVMKTSMDNIGAIFHPAVTALNAAWIESTGGEFDYYTEGITPSVALVLEEMDKERVGVAEAMGFRAMTAREWLYVAYDATGKNLYEAMRDNPGYRGIRAPRTINVRYITEDVPMSLVPISSLGKEFGAETPTIDHIIHLACLMHGRDYWKEGRTAEKLGVAGLTLKQLRHLILEGEV